jgi:hypothetical protein
MGVTDKQELKKQITLSKQGHLGAYLHSKGEKFTFGLLKAIFKDAIDAKKKTTLKKNIFNLLIILYINFAFLDIYINKFDLFFNYLIFNIWHDYFF